MTLEPALTAEREQHSSFEAWRASGGGRGLERALRDRAQARDEVARSGLRGMGGAGFPTSRKWQAALEAGGGGWVICNGNEDEPGTFKDRRLLAQSPHQVIEGAIIAALATSARHVVFYVNPHHLEVPDIVRTAVQAWSNDALLARARAAVGGELTLHVRLSSGLYVGGEDTAAIASVQGGFPFPRKKPPYPTESGVHGQPTVVNNVETLALVRHILEHGAAWYRARGRAPALGSKLFCLSGDVVTPGLFELPLGVTLRELVYQHGGGVLDGRAFKAAFTGGPSNTLLSAAELDLPLDFDTLREHGARLGTGAIVVVSEGTSIVRRVADYVDFFANSSCGQCPSCRVGTQEVTRLLRRIESGVGTQRDLSRLDNLAAILPGSGRCGLVDGAVAVLTSSRARFDDEYTGALRKHD